MSKNISELSGRQGLKNNLFERFNTLVKENSRPSTEELKELADDFLIGSANTYGAISFYDFLKPGNQGKKVYVCNGSVCMCAGTQDKLKDELLKHFEKDEIGEMCCLGRCHENSAFQLGGKNYSGKLNGSLDEVLKNHTTIKDDFAIDSIGPAILTTGTVDLLSFADLLENLIAKSQDEVFSDIEDSQLKGRGGAGFPISIKLQTCRNTASSSKFIICNADEGDPGAFSDRYLLEEKPYDVLFGMMMAGYVTDANYGIVYIRGEYPESVEIIDAAIKNLEQKTLIGENILQSGFSFQFKVIKAQGSYLCGEETALINSIEGQRPEVRIRPPFPAQEGLFNKPTIVNNVETLAFLPYILKNGGKAFSKIGTENSKGTKLLSLDSGFVRPGIYEAEMGTSLGQLISENARGFARDIKALHIGGPLGGIVPTNLIDNLTIDFESFAKNGFLLGHASIVSIPSDFPIIRYLEHLFKFAAEESCGKCFPCRLGTKRAEELFHKAQNENYKIDKRLIDDLLHTLEVGSLCAHGGGIPLPVRNVLTYFKDELEPYFD